MHPGGHMTVVQVRLCSLTASPLPSSKPDYLLLFIMKVFAALSGNGIFLFQRIGAFRLSSDLECGGRAQEARSLFVRRLQSLESLDGWPLRAVDSRYENWASHFRFAQIARKYTSNH
jgi:hypothetical protein